MNEKHWILGFTALLTACSNGATTGGGGYLPLDATQQDSVIGVPDIDAQASSTTDAAVKEIASDIKIIDSTDVAAAPSDCQSCESDDECASGWFCAQFQGSSYCARDCTAATCGSGHACTAEPSAAGDQLEVCVPIVSPCAAAPDEPDSGPSDTSVSDVNSLVCGSLNGPSVKSCCVCSGKSCDPNGCFGGWFCNTGTCKCNPAPDPSTCSGPDAGPTDTGPVDSGSGKDASTADSSSVQSIGPSGGTLSSLDFAIVGDTRPANKDDLAGYPTTVITKIFQDVQAENPPIPFVITTGDYQFSSPSSNNAAPQFDLYLKAQTAFAGTVFHTMGNHECTGATNSNCGTGNADGLTNTYNTFMTKLMAPLGVSQPWYVVNVKAADGSWTAKFVFIAANAWSSAQSTWLDAAMAKPTTYTFVVRHEGSIVTETAGVAASAAVFGKYPYTLLLVGHTHTFEYYASERQVVTGNGGAPLAASINYGYVVARQRADKALVITAYDYATHATIQTFVVKPDGTPTK